MIDRIKNKLRQIAYSKVLYKFGYGSRVSKSIWEKQFGGEEWDYLYSDAEKDHYLAIAGLLNGNGPGKILDIGCGQGVLYHYLTQELGTLNYLGIDISSNAVAKAKNSFPEGGFDTLDFEYENLEGKFDVIIFNETLYYFNRPLTTIQKCINQNLNKGGCLIISMCEYTGHEVIWQKLKQRFNFLSFEEITNANDQKWKVGLFKP